MSLISQVSTNFDLIADIIEKFEDVISKTDNIFDLDNKNLEQLCKTHPKNLFFYKTQANDLKSLEEFIDIKISEKHSILYKKHLSTSNRTLSPKDIQQYVDSEPEYNQLREIRLEIISTKRRFDSIVKALEDMSWMLAHITKLRVAELEDAIL